MILRSVATIARASLPVALLLAAFAAPGRAQLVSDTLAHFDAPSSMPMIALDATDGTPHVGYRNDTALVHAWQAGGVWQSEVALPAFAIAPGYEAMSWDVGAGGRAAVAWDAGDGTLRYAVRESGTWNAETVTANGAWGYAPSLTFDPATGEPLLAFVAREPRGADPVLAHLELARRRGGVWTITELDTSSGDVGPPSVALDSHGEPRLAICRRIAADGGKGGLYFVEASAGPFTWTRVDTTSAGYAGLGTGTASLALDRWSDEPRIAYTYVTGVWGLRYAYRSAGIWSSTVVIAGDAASTAEQVSLALTPAGDPRIVQTQDWNVLAEGTPAEVEGGCGGAGAVSSKVLLFKRAGAEGSAAFTAVPVSAPRQTRSSARAVVSGVADGARLVWRDPKIWHPGCFNDIVHATDAPTTAVPPASTTPSRFAVGPNPLRAGATMTLRLGSVRTEELELSLIDIAGRRVASTRVRRDAQVSDVLWTPEGLHAGVYRVIVRAGGARREAAAIVVLN